MNWNERLLQLNDETFSPFRTEMVTVVVVLVIAIAMRASGLNGSIGETTKLPGPMNESNIFYINSLDDQEARTSNKNVSALHKMPSRAKNRIKNSTFNDAVRAASLQGFKAMIDLYERKEPEILRKGQQTRQAKNVEHSDANKSFQVNFLTQIIRQRN